MKPEKFLQKSEQLLKELQRAQTQIVAVGLPKEKAQSKIYKNHESVITVGASHEYGVGNLPRRSFLRMPFNVKKKQLQKTINAQFNNVLYKNMKAESALSLIGVSARNIVLEAFKTQGFGKWKPDSEITKARKKSSKVLIDTGILRSSITWVVRRK